METAWKPLEEETRSAPLPVLRNKPGEFYIIIIRGSKQPEEGRTVKLHEEKLMEKILQQLKKEPMTKGELRNHIFFGSHDPASLLSELQEKSLIASQRVGRTDEYFLKSRMGKGKPRGVR